MILVSSCLAGLHCRYNGSHSLVDEIGYLVQQGKAVFVCPELLAGLPTPREPAEIVGGTGEDVLDGKARVIEPFGKDVSDIYIKGAYNMLEMVKQLNPSCIVLKDWSPSCGSKMIYDGSFGGKKIAGAGVTTALLRREGYRVISEDELQELLVE